MIYLNNAATSFPKPKAVLEAVTKILSNVPFHASRVGVDIQQEDIIFACRQKLAQLFNAPNPNQIVFTSGSTESLNLAIRGLNLKDQHVITTAIEHNSVLRPLKRLESQGKIRLSIVDCNSCGSVNPNDISEAIQKDTTLIAINHCSNVTGEVQDIKTISEIAHHNEIIFLVDASQSAGCYPIDVQESHIDLLAFTGHKSLYGIQGIGGLYIREGLDLEPLSVGGTGTRSDLLTQPEGMPIHYEAGTQNLPGIASLNAGANFILETGMDNIKRKKQKLFVKMMTELKEIPEIKIYGREDAAQRVPIFCFNINGFEPSDLGYILRNSFHIIVRSGLHCAPLIHKALGSYPNGSVRVSPSYFTTVDEIDQFIQAVKQICM